MGRLDSDQWVPNLQGGWVGPPSVESHLHQTSELQGTISETQIADGSITEAKLDPAVVALLSNVNVTGVGGTVVGGNPDLTVAFGIQVGTHVVTYATGGNIVTYPVTFSTGVFGTLITPGDDEFNLFTCPAVSQTTAHFKVKIYNPLTGAEVGAGGLYRLNWLAVGW